MKKNILKNLIDRKKNIGSIGILDFLISYEEQLLKDEEIIEVIQPHALINNKEYLQKKSKDKELTKKYKPAVKSSISKSTKINETKAIADQFASWSQSAPTYLNILDKRDQLIHLYFKDDNAYFLVNYGVFLISFKRAVYTMAEILGDRLCARFGRELFNKLNNKEYVNFQVSYAYSMVRVGKFESAIRYLDEVIATANSTVKAVLLRAKAECCWQRDPIIAIKALKEASLIKSGTASHDLSLSFLLAGQTNGAPELIGKSDQLPLIQANYYLDTGDKDSYWKALNQYFHSQNIGAIRCDGQSIFEYANLSALYPAIDNVNDFSSKKVTVIMTTYNSAETLTYAVKSILLQSHRNFELIIVDDGSTDTTHNMLAVLEKMDARVKVLLNEKNLGTYGAKNKAIHIASGDYITCHDSDDWAHPQRLESHLQLMEGNPQLVATRSFWLRTTSTGRILPKRWGRSFVHPNPASTFMRKEVVNKIGCFDNVRYSADAEYWLRLRKIYGDERVVSLNKCLALGLSREESLTKGGSGAFSDDQFSQTRNDYFQSVIYYHAYSAESDFYGTSDKSSRPFWAPEEMIIGLATNNYRKSHIPLRYGGSTNPNLPNFVFGISLASAQVSSDWAKTTRLLSQTLQSLLAQSDGRFMVLICGHEHPGVPEMSDSRVVFFECDAAPPKDSSRYRNDKMRKRRLLGSALRELGGGYFFPLDADDLVHKNFVEYALKDDNRRGYLIHKGYVLDDSNKKLAKVKDVWDNDFNFVCGSSAAIYFEKDELPTSGDANRTDLYFNLFQSHAYWSNVAREYGRPIQRVPFNAAVYVINHTQNLSFILQRVGQRASNIVRTVGTYHLDDSDLILVNDFGQNN